MGAAVGGGFTGAAVAVAVTVAVVAVPLLGGGRTGLVLAAGRALGAAELAELAGLAELSAEAMGCALALVPGLTTGTTSGSPTSGPGSGLAGCASPALPAGVLVPPPLGSAAGRDHTQRPAPSTPTTSAAAATFATEERSCGGCGASIMPVCASCSSVFESACVPLDPRGPPKETPCAACPEAGCETGSEVLRLRRASSGPSSASLSPSACPSAATASPALPQRAAGSRLQARRNHAS